MSKESIIIKTIVITVLFIMIALTPDAHAAQVSIMPLAVSMEGTSHAFH